MVQTGAAVPQAPEPLTARPCVPIPTTMLATQHTHWRFDGCDDDCAADHP